MSILYEDQLFEAGGHAFPSHEVGVHGAVTLRDYFAVRALIPLLQDNLATESIQTYDNAVEAAYVIADLMLEVRLRKDPLRR